MPRQMTGTSTKIRPKQEPHILEAPKWSVGEHNFPDHFSKNAIFLQNNGQSTSKSESQLQPFWRVHLQGLESTLDMISSPEGLSKTIADSCPASLKQVASLCFEKSILVFMGVCVCVCVCFAPRKKGNVETHMFRPW